MITVQKEKALYCIRYFMIIIFSIYFEQKGGQCDIRYCRVLELYLENLILSIIMLKQGYNANSWMVQNHPAISHIGYIDF